MATPPLVSVLIGAYNAEPWIAETLASVTAQSHDNVEVIVVDDGSTDGTLAVAQDVAAAHPDVVRVISQENRGACAARNRALQEARGDYVQFLDADDVLHPDKLRLQLARLAVEPEGTVATGPWVRFTGDVADADHTGRGPDWMDYEAPTDWLVQSWSGHGTIPAFSWLVPRSLVGAAGAWNEGLLRNQDGEYFARVLVRARKLAFCEGAWGYYRSAGSGSVSARKSADALRSLYQSYALCEGALLSHRNTEEARRACACLWQSFMYVAYPQVPTLVRQAEERAEKLGGGLPDRQPSGGRAFDLLRDTIGWKTALRLRRQYHRVRYPDLAGA